MLSPPRSAPSYGRHRRLALSTTGDPDVLLRVLMTLRRRGYSVLRVEYEHGDVHRSTVFELSVESTRRTAHQLEAWLSNIVGVLTVRDTTFPGS
jgi:acetolactate synthase regulatory subunit